MTLLFHSIDSDCPVTEIVESNGEDAVTFYRNDVPLGIKGHKNICPICSEKVEDYVFGMYFVDFNYPLSEVKS